MGVIGINPEYFWDKMSKDELIAINKARYESNKSEWEQTRLICYWSVVSMNGPKIYKTPSDLFKLPWDKGYKVTSNEAKEKLSKDGKK